MELVLVIIVQMEAHAGGLDITTFVNARVLTKASIVKVILLSVLCSGTLRKHSARLIYSKGFVAIKPTITSSQFIYLSSSSLLVTNDLNFMGIFTP